MARDQVVPSGPRRVLSSSFTLALLGAGLMTSLLTLAGGALIEETPAVEERPSLGCSAFQVGSPHAANTHVHLENGGPERIHVQLYFVDHDGRNSQTIGYNPILEPWASSDFMFRTPALGAAVELISSGRNLHARTEIRRDDGASPESRKAIGCLGVDLG
jgi:hypothetical protein